MIGFIYSAVAGAAMSIQGVMNTRLSDKIGLYESNVFVQGTAFVLSLIAMWILGKGNFRAIGDVNKGYLLGGALGIVITITVMLSMSRLTPATAVSAILIAQLFTAAVIDAFGLMGTEKEAFGWNKYVGLALMVGGMLLFKLKNSG
ncbi:MAG: DMT family transporter [Monoglobales bacterium]